MGLSISVFPVYKLIVPLYDGLHVLLLVQCVSESRVL